MPKIKNISLLLPDEPIPPPYDGEISFNNTVREYILFGIVLLMLIIISHIIILRFLRKDPTPFHRTHNFHYDDEAFVDKVALWLCTFSLSISLGAVLLLPISILTNEVLTIYKDSLYIKWINLSLIQGLWNMIFLCSNISLFIGLPFAYLFTEAEGFPGSKKGIRARIIETVVVLSLLVVLVFGVSFIISFSLGYYEEDSIYHTIGILSTFYLPFMYSLISCLGVLFLLLCTPVGFARLFTVLGQLVLKPTRFLKDFSEEYQAAVFQEEALAHQLQNMTHHVEYQALPILRPKTRAKTTLDQILVQYNAVKELRIKLDKQRNIGIIKRTLTYPLAFIILLFLTGTSVIIVGLNTLQLLIGLKALPLSSTPAILGETQQGKRFVFLSMIGPIGAVFEVLLILYLIAASVLGCYSIPCIRKIKPRTRDTPMVDVIANCLIVLLLSSALPLLVRTLGITNFDLLGDYGKISWLGHFGIVLGYNVGFASASASCLVEKFTVALRQEILQRYKDFQGVRNYFETVKITDEQSLLLSDEEVTGFVVIDYDGKWYPSYVLNSRDRELRETTVSCLSPHGPNPSFFYPPCEDLLTRWGITELSKKLSRGGILT